MTPLLLAGTLAGTLAAAFTAVDKTGENAAAILEAGKNATNRFIPSDFRNSDTARDLHRALAA
jgi:hypothetical protein